MNQQSTKKVGFKQTVTYFALGVVPVSHRALNSIIVGKPRLMKGKGRKELEKLAKRSNNVVYTAKTGLSFAERYPHEKGKPKPAIDLLIRRIKGKLTVDFFRKNRKLALVKGACCKDKKPNKDEPGEEDYTASIIFARLSTRKMRAHIAAYEQNKELHERIPSNKRTEKQKEFLRNVSRALQAMRTTANNFEQAKKELEKKQAELEQKQTKNK